MSDELKSKDQNGSGSLPSEPPKKRRGRPPGRKTERLHYQRKVQERCQKCKSSEFVVLRTDSKEIIGTIDGVDFNLVTWRRVKCGCGQQRMIVTYRLAIE